MWVETGTRKRVWKKDRLEPTSMSVESRLHHSKIVRPSLTSKTRVHSRAQTVVLTIRTVVHRCCTMLITRSAGRPVLAPRPQGLGRSPATAAYCGFLEVQRALEGNGFDSLMTRAQVILFSIESCSSGHSKWPIPFSTIYGDDLWPPASPTLCYFFR